MADTIQPRVAGGVDIALAEEVIAKARLLKKGTAQQGLVYCDAGETPIGASLNAATTIGDPVEYSEAGTPNWVVLEAGGVIAAGAEFKVAADGKIVAKVSAAEDSVGVLHPRQVATASGDLVIGRLYDRPIRYPAAVDAETLHALNVEVPAAGDDEWVLSYEHATTEFLWVAALTLTAPASQAQGDVYYHNGTTFARLAAGTKGHVLMTGGAAANPSFVAPRSYLHVGPFADVAANTTFVIKVGNVPSGRVWVPLHLTILSGTTADATAQLKAAGVGAMDALAIDGDTDTVTFTDSSFAAGQAITVDIVTQAGTGDCDAPIVVLCIADLPA